MNRCLQEADVPNWMTKGKTVLIQKDSLKGTTPKQLQTHNVPTYDVENTNSTNKGGDLLLVNKPWTLPQGTKDTASGPGVQESYCTLINTSSMRAR